MIQLAGKLLDHTGRAAASLRSTCAVVIGEMAPEHMLYSVGDVKDTYANALCGFVQRVEKHPLAFLVNQVTLFEERIFSQVAVVQSPGIFGEPQRGVETLQLREINRIRQRM